MSYGFWPNGKFHCFPGIIELITINNSIIPGGQTCGRGGMYFYDLKSKVTAGLGNRTGALGSKAMNLTTKPQTWLFLEKS